MTKCGLAMAALMIAASTALAGLTTQVTNTNDSGAGSLRQAILNANSNVGTDNIQFLLMGAGPHIIQPATALPTITGPVTIDGFTQAGADCFQLKVVLDGQNLGGNAVGLDIIGGGSTVRGIVIQNFAAAGIRLAGGDGNVITSNFIGTDVTGLIAAPNGDGILIEVQGSGPNSEASDNNRIGTNSDGADDECERNVISGNDGSGIHAVGTSMATPVGTLIAGNYIGVDVTSQGALGNGIDGIRLTMCNEFYIGLDCGNTNVLAGRNVISSNAQDGVRCDDADSCAVAGNYIGVAADGLSPRGNGQMGVDFMAGSIQNRIGTELCTPCATEGNIIANSTGGEGVQFNGAASGDTIQNTILGNSIYSNAGLGICLTPSNCVNDNDLQDVDTGPNQRQNFPDLTSANGVTIAGTLNSVPNRRYRVEFFANTVPDDPCNMGDASHGEGEVFVTAIIVTTDALGNAMISAPYFPVFGKPYISSTATGLGPIGGTADCLLADPQTFNTSEFSGTILQVQACDLMCEDITVEAAPGTCQALVNFEPDVSDECTLDYTIECFIVPPGMDGIPVTSPHSFSLGTTHILCRLVDEEEETISQCEFDVTVTGIDEPGLTCPDDMTGVTPAGTCSADVSFAPTVNPGCTHTADDFIVICRANGQEITSPHTFPAGSTTVECCMYFRDPAIGPGGPPGELVECCEFTVTIIESPEITCPANITVPRDEGRCFASVSFNPELTFTCDPSFPDRFDFVCTVDGQPITSPHDFPVGTTTVQCCVILAPRSLFDCCSFTVTVTDDADLEIICPDDISVTAGADACTASVEFTPEVLVDPCNPDAVGFTVTCTVDSQTVTSPFDFPVGTTIVECCVYVDPPGLGDPPPGAPLDCCTFTVTVTDDQDPTLVCRQETEVEVGECGTVYLTALDVVSVFFDNCPLDCCDPKLAEDPATCGLSFSPSVLECPQLNVPIPIAVTGTDCHGNTATCVATVIIRGDDCNNNGLADACDICSGTSLDCNENWVPDECECFWCNVQEVIEAIPVPDVNAQLSHLGGGTACGEKVADDFYLEPGCVHRITAVRGKLLTNSIAQLRRARIELYEDCDGKPVDEPFLVFDYQQEDPVASEIIDVQPALDGFSLVTYRFDLCDECIWLEGGKSYWVSLIGLTDNIDMVDLSYWVAGDESLPILGSVPVKRSGTPGSTWGSCTFGPWQSLEDCCIGCVNMDFCVDGYSCPIIWDNGKIDLVDRGGSPSGGHQQYHDRTADSFVIKACRDEDLCLIKAWIWTNCEPVNGFIELYEDLPCGPPELPNDPFRSYSGDEVKATRLPETWTFGGRTYQLWRLEVKNPDIVLIGGRNYWVSAGANSTGNFNTNSFFAWSKYGCDPCNGVESYRITPGQHRTLRPPPTEWADVIPARDFAFLIAANGPDAIPQDDPGDPEVPVGEDPGCIADSNNDGAVAVDDIFTFLSAWFVGCP